MARIRCGRCGNINIVVGHGLTRCYFCGKKRKRKKLRKKSVDKKMNTHSEE